MERNHHILLAATALIVLGVSAALLLIPSTSDTKESPVPPTACTMDARICPDGSAVGRIPPNCEFAACPTSVATTSSIIPGPTPEELPQDASSFDAEFVDASSRYGITPPSTLSTRYITPVEWPPKLFEFPAPLTCEEGFNQNSIFEEEQWHVVDGTSYCVRTRTEGAAGSIYSTYLYRFAQDDIVLGLEFTLRAVQCLNYDDPKRTECIEERETFDLDRLIHSTRMTLSPRISR